MAPKKRNADSELANPAVPAAGARVTRSMASRSRRNSANYSVAAAPTQAPKKRKTTKAKTATASHQKKSKASASKNEEEEEEPEEEEVKANEEEEEEEPQVEKGKSQVKKEATQGKEKLQGKNEAKKDVKSEEKVEEKSEPEDEDAKDGSSPTSKTVIIEHCKQCSSFKKAANTVKVGLEGNGISVVINPEKPRRGCFEIREEGEIFISLLDMKRPFKPMKELNMDQVISDIVKKIQS